MTTGIVLTDCESCGCSEGSCAGCTAPSDCSSCRSCCCSSSHQSWRDGRIKAGIKLEYFSAAWMAVEVVGSIGAGLLAGSLALIAFGGDSVIELLSAFLVLSYLRDSGASGARSAGIAKLSSGLLFALIPVIGVAAVYSYLTGARPEGSPAGIAIATGAVVVMPYLWLKKRRIGKEARCLPLSIDAVESATCFLMSVALLAGLLVEYAFRLWWVDYLATGIILVFVIKEAAESYQEIDE